MPASDRTTTIALAPAGVLSLVGGLILVFQLIRVETIDAMPTPVLLGLLGLLALPAITAWSFVLQQRFAARRAEPLAVEASQPVVESSHPLQVIHSGQVVTPREPTFSASAERPDLEMALADQAAADLAPRELAAINAITVRTHGRRALIGASIPGRRAGTRRLKPLPEGGVGGGFVGRTNL